MKFILGKKLEMTQKYTVDGNAIAVTKVLAGPCFISQIKNQEKDGYIAVQIGLDGKGKIKKPQLGHLKKTNGNLKYLKEVRLFKAEGVNKLKVGDQLDASIFETGDPVEATGISKGKGFQGVVKRWGFGGSPASHGHKDQLRMPGAIGAGGVQRVFKGMKMGGRMGGEQVTIKNLEIIEVDKDNNFLFIKGAIPGPQGGLILIKGPGDLKLTDKTSKINEIATSLAEKSEPDKAVNNNKKS